MASAEDNQGTVKRPSGEFARVVNRAKAAILWERLAPKAAAPLGVAGLFLSASWLGLWGALPPQGRMAGVIVLGAAALVSPLLVRTGSLANLKKQAVNRIDANANHPDRPAQVLSDRVPDESGPGAQELWQAHQDKVAAKWAGKLKAGKPAPDWKRHDPFKLRFAIAVLTAATAVLAGEQRYDLAAKAFDWTVPPPAVIPADIKAWVTPPDYTGLPPVYLNEKAAPENAETSRLPLPEGSVLTIVSMNGPTQIGRDGNPVPEPKIMKAATGPEKGKITARYEMQLTPQDGCFAVQNGPKWCFNVIADLPPTVKLDGAGESKKPAGILEINCTAKDDYGVEEAEVLIEPAKPGAPDARPLPVAGIPPVALQGGPATGPCVK